MKRLFFIAVMLSVCLLLMAGPALAAIESYAVKDTDNLVYQYKLQDMLESYNRNGPLWNDFHTRMMRAGVYAVYDDKSLQFIDFPALLAAYNTGMDVTNYTESANAKTAFMPDMVRQVTTSPDGKLVFADIPRPGNAIAAVNSTNSVQELRKIVEKEASLLGLDLTVYQNLNTYGKNTAVKAILDVRPAAGYQTATDLKLQFDNAVQTQHLQQVMALGSVNNAWDAAMLQSALTAGAVILELDITRFDSLALEQKNLVLQIIFANKPFTNANTLKNIFHNALQNLGVTRILSYMDYPHTMNQAVTLQMGRNPQTDLLGGGWQTADRNLVEWFMNVSNFVEDMRPAATISVGPARLRTGPGTDYASLTLLEQGSGPFYIVNEAQDSAGFRWYRLLTATRVGWVREDLLMITERKGEGIFQFLLLSGTTSVNPVEVNEKILTGKGTLEGQADAFILGAEQYNINEIFLISLALHETGGGTSVLSSGFEYNGQIVYNMFGIGAIDADPVNKGAEYAYNRGWFTPELAILGGAEFISNLYVNHPTYQQNTLYKMRWNPATPGIHQYATDIGWAAKQVNKIKELYDQCSSYILRFEIPRYGQ